MYEFHLDYIKNQYDNNLRLLFRDTDCSLMYIIKNVFEDFCNDKKMFDFRNYLTKSKYFDDLNKLVVGKMKHETSSVAIERFVRLKVKIHSFLADDKSEHKKAKGIRRNAVATIIHNEYKDVLFKKKCLRHLNNRIKVKII